MVDRAMYMPDYPISRLVAFQLKDHLAQAGVPLGVEFESISKIGNVTPCHWMRLAVGAPLLAEPLLAATRNSLERVDVPAAGSD